MRPGCSRMKFLREASLIFATRRRARRATAGAARVEAGLRADVLAAAATAGGARARRRARSTPACDVVPRGHRRREPRPRPPGARVRRELRRADVGTGVSVHRVGRAGRRGRPGAALTLYVRRRAAAPRRRESRARRAGLRRRALVPRRGRPAPRLGRRRGRGPRRVRRKRRKGRNRPSTKIASGM